MYKTGQVSNYTGEEKSLLAEAYKTIEQIILMVCCDEQSTSLSDPITSIQFCHSQLTFNIILGNDGGGGAVCDNEQSVSFDIV